MPTHERTRTLVIAVSVLCGSCNGTGLVDPAARASRPQEVVAPTGSVVFPTSAGPAAQAEFERGVALLHSFGYDRAREAFVRARTLEPGFALAYWGESLTYNHLLSPERDLESPQRALLRLGPTREVRLSKATTELERGFLRAVEALWMNPGSEAERRIAYLRAMERLYAGYPEDVEVASFYALALLVAIGPLEDTSSRLAMRAGAISLELMARQPLHPGAAHYTIHAFDDPIHAPLALPAARHYAEIAPAVSHALHMPSHIFMQLGMWQQALDSNRAAFRVAEAQWRPIDSPGDQFHAADWAHYSALQLGNATEASDWIERVDAAIERTSPLPRFESAGRMLRARQMIEREQWELVPLRPDSTASEALAAGLAASKLGELDRADAARRRLTELAQRGDEGSATFDRGSKPARVSELEVLALIALNRREIEVALRHLDAAIAVAETMGAPRGAAVPLKPIHELYGEVLLELGRPKAAAEKFEQSLRLMPERRLSLRGLDLARSSGSEAPE